MIGAKETGSQMRIRRWQIHLLVLAAYILFALVLTWPVASRLDTHVPGNGADDPPLTWNLWWVQDALLKQGVNPFDCDLLFYPLGINLAFYTLTVLNGLLSIPVQAVAGLIPASNLLLLSSFVLSGYGAFLLSSYALSRSPSTARRSPALDLGSLLPSFGAGLLYAFASSKLAYAALGQWNIASSQWIPFYALCLLKMGDHPRRWRYPLLAALFLLLQAYAELTYATFLVLFTALWAVWQIVTRLRSGELWRLAGNLVLIGCILAVGLLPVLAMMIPDLMVEGDIFVEKGGFADAFSADLVGFLVPTMYHPLFGSLVEQFKFDYSVGQHLYLGYSVLALAVVGAVWAWRRSSALKFWTLSTVVFWLMTLGPSLRINGQDTGIPLPFALVAELPFFKGNRYPSRYSVLFVLSLAMLVAFGLAAIVRRRENGSRLSAGPALRQVAGLILVAVILFEHLSVPLPVSDMRVPAVYQAIADEMPGDFTLLDLPVAWRNGFRVTGTQHPIIMFQQYYQSVHGKRILAGNTSRNPPLKFQYFTKAPVISTIIALETGHQVDASVADLDRALAADVLRFFNIQAIVVRPERTGPDMVPYIEDTMPVEVFYEDEEVVAYRVDLASWPESWVVVPGDDLSRLSYAEGWGIAANGVQWAQRKAVRLLVPLNGAEQQMAFRAYAPMAGQQLELEVNGLPVEQIEMADGWMDYEVTLPAEAVQAGLNEVWLRFGTLKPASQVHLSGRSIGQTGVESPVNLVVHSAGQEVGDFGHIYIDGMDVAPNERGYNVAIIHPQTGFVEETAAFDTHLDAAASDKLAGFLGGVPAGRIVAVAASDEASRLLGEGAVEALRGIGAAGDLRDKFRWGHAIIGVQGATPGAALEAMDWMRPVAVVAGEGATEPGLAAAFAEITFRAERGE
jgi:hypothetical protein